MLVKKLICALVDALLLAVGIILFIQFLPAFQNFQILTTMGFPAEVGMLLGALLGILLMLFSLISLIMVLVNGNAGKIHNTALHFGRTAWAWIFVILFAIMLGFVLSNPSVTEEMVMNFLMGYAYNWVTYAVIGGTVLALIFNLIGVKTKGVASVVLRIIALGITGFVGYLTLSNGVDTIIWVCFVLAMIALGCDIVVPLLKN